MEAGSVAVDADGVVPVEELKTTPSGPVLGMRFPEAGGRSLAPFKASRWTLRAGEQTDWDRHDVLEIWMVAAGSGSVWRGEQETAVAPGDVVFMPSQVPHRLHNPGPETMSLFSVWWQPPAVDAPDA